MVSCEDKIDINERSILSMRQGIQLDAVAALNDSHLYDVVILESNLSTKQ